MEELMANRETIVVRWKLEEDPNATGYDEILAGVEAERARAKALGKNDVETSVYEEATLAMGQGMAKTNQLLDEQYDKEFALIELMADGAKKTAAQNALDAQYQADKKKAAEEYATALSEVVMPLWGEDGTDGVGKTTTKIQTLLGLLSAYSSAEGGQDRAGALTNLKEFSDGLDEGELTNYLGILTQIQTATSGMTPEEASKLFPTIDTTAMMGDLAGVMTYLQGMPTELAGLSEMFTEAIPKEMIQVGVELDDTEFQKKWEEIEKDTSKVDTTVALVGYNLTALTRYKKQKGDIEIPAVAKVGSMDESEIIKLLGTEGTIWKDGVELPVSPEVVATLKPSDLAVTHEDGTTHILCTAEIVGTKESVKDALGKTENLQYWLGIGQAGTTDMMAAAVKELEASSKSGLHNGWGLWTDGLVKSTWDSIQKRNFDSDKLGKMTTYYSELAKYISEGGTPSTADVENLKTLGDFYATLTKLEVGEGMRTAIESALTTGGLDMGEDFSQSLAALIAQYASPTGATGSGGSFDVAQEKLETKAEDVAGAAVETAGATLSSDALYQVGANATLGMARGIGSGKKAAVSAMQEVADAVKDVPVKTYDIHSPSRVFDYNGRMVMRGFGDGFVAEGKVQEKVIANAMAHMRSTAENNVFGGGLSAGGNRVYNQQSSVSVSGNTFQVRDDQDVQALAIEIATLTKRQQRGRGHRT